MIISLIVAMDRRGVIGAGGALPWRLSDDLKQFKAVTMGKPLIMGRKTHESIGRPLPGRRNIVLTRQRDYEAPGCVVCHDVESALAACAGFEEVMVMGGASLYELFLPRAGRIYLTRVEAEVNGDTHFPPFDESAWNEIERRDHQADERNEYPCSFLVLEKKGYQGSEFLP
ncbi:MAG: type 3 dihydrofolate reductase [Gammaproteobacteria bacterium]|nr:type 3 dihydrofolate reductase [Gammaproteobacteria bacterium]MDE0283122.1 type 3 dihydrofolate reductase [Gammaproteobacteria bacterium]MDE0513759.1 type 3 dihydrofolate reductase [Gammaproteobacteria bacterium]